MEPLCQFHDSDIDVGGSRGRVKGDAEKGDGLADMEKTVRR